MTDVLIRLLQSLRLYAPAKKIKDRLLRFTPGYGRRRRAMVQFYGQLVSAGDLCFDIGANLGNRTEAFLELGARVVAIEPQRVCFDQLIKRYGHDGRVTVIPKAVGERPGQGQLMLSQAHTLSSMSAEWLHRVKSSGRFRAYDWDRTTTVPITTLDELVAQFGTPAFCKIDVEGFELPVLRGLSRPLRTLSFEFAPEFLHATIGCLDHLSTIGAVEFNYSVGESMQLGLPHWVKQDEMSRILASLPDRTIFGDVYARFV